MSVEPANSRAGLWNPPKRNHGHIAAIARGQSVATAESFLLTGSSRIGRRALEVATQRPVGRSGSGLICSQASKSVSPAIAQLDDTDRQTFQHDRRPHHPQPTPGHPPKSWVVAGVSRTPTQTKDFLHQERRVGPRRCDHVQLRSLLRHCPSRRKCLPLDHRPGLPE